ncbi:MAG: QueT transporter family protein [Ruminococcaceae bacterium]|jgi:uncharacterized membrane protein|nr:QueT transporter family protein [Oscillospiraceae bacterium]
MKNNKIRFKGGHKTRFITTAAMIAAMYVALSWVSQLLGLCSGAIQCRISEALCVLPIFTTAAIPGVTLGCLITNLLFGSGNPFDIAFGTLASLIGVLVCYAIRKLPWAASVPTILSNALIVPAVLILFFPDMNWGMYGLLAVQVGIGELIACGVLGTLLLFFLKRHPKIAGTFGGAIRKDTAEAENAG